MTEPLTPADLQRLIADSPLATSNVLRWLDSHGIEHSGRISGATLGSVVCRHDPRDPEKSRAAAGRAWRRWVGGQSPMPSAAWRLLVEISGVDVDGQVEAA